MNRTVVRPQALTTAPPIAMPAPVVPWTQSVAALPLAAPVSTNGPSNTVQRVAEAPKAGVATAGYEPATNLTRTGSVTRVSEPVVIPPAPKTNEFPRAVQDWFEAQVALDRLAISCGSIDGVPGAQSRSALRAFQAKAGLGTSGELDEATRSRLILGAAPCVNYRVTAQDLARLQPLSPTWLGKSRQTTLEYETILELLAENGHAHPRLIRSLNPAIRWGEMSPGECVSVPDAAAPAPGAKAAVVLISLGDKTLEAFDAEGHLMAHFPCSIAQRVEKRPVGDLHVVVVVRGPTYTFNPEIFPESAEARQLKTKLLLPAGPNNPVGLAWIGLDKSGYGIHGTPSPEQVGRTESHGCFRLANWNAQYLVSLAWVGMPVRVVK